MSNEYITEAVRGVPSPQFRRVDVTVLPSTARTGATAVKEDAISIAVPSGRSDHSRVIRIHEMLHSRVTFLETHLEAEARLRADGILEDAIEAADDVYIHRQCILSRFADDKSFARAARNVARADIRSIKDTEDRANAVLVYARSLSLLLGTRQRYRRPTAPVGPLDQHDLTEIETAVGQLVRTPRGTIAERAYDACARRLDALIRDVAVTGAETGGGGREPGGEESEAAKVLPDMAVVERPRPRNVVGRQLARREARSTTGRLTQRVSDMVRGVVAHDPRMLFRRIAPAAGGTVLIDASGSMSLTDDDLLRLAEYYSSGTIAAYSGYYSPGFFYGRPALFGELHILARNGRVVERDSSRFRDYGNNAVDRDALCWLLCQPAPRIIVTDGEFCGGRSGQANAARTLLRRAVACGKVIRYRKLDEALRHGR